MIKNSLKLLTVFLLILVFLSFDYSGNSKKKSYEFTYGVSFSRFHSDELDLDWKEAYLAILNDLGVRQFRFSAHWPLTEPKNGKFNFQELDFQISQAEKNNAKFILAVGRRLPGWPECHVPDWADSLNQDEQKKEILEYITTVVSRYKNSPALLYWQIENEPYLSFFSRQACGIFDEEFLESEIALVKSLDSKHPILLTDSGELSLWYKPYKRSDIFGTSLYLYIWNHTLGEVKYPITYHFFRIKNNIIKLLFGEKKAVVIELSTEPWLLQPIKDTPIETQLERMGVDKFKEMISFSSKTGFDTFYLWGAEWWYWLNKNGHPEHWNMAKQIFLNNR